MDIFLLTAHWRQLTKIIGKYLCFRFYSHVMLIINHDDRRKKKLYLGVKYWLE